MWRLFPDTHTYIYTIYIFWGEGFAVQNVFFIVINTQKVWKYWTGDRSSRKSSLNTSVSHAASTGACVLALLSLRECKALDSSPRSLKFNWVGIKNVSRVCEQRVGGCWLFSSCKWFGVGREGLGGSQLGNPGAVSSPGMERFVAFFLTCKMVCLESCHKPYFSSSNPVNKHILILCVKRVCLTAALISTRVTGGATLALLAAD